MALLKDVEPDIIFRHFVWSVLFVAAAAYYINTYIMPHVDDYKEQVRFTRVTQGILDNTRSINSDAQSKLSAFSSSNHEKLKVFGGTINETILRKYLPKELAKVKIKKVKEELIPSDQLKKQVYTISGETTVSNLSAILAIVPKLHEKNISVILELPFTLKKTPKNNLEFSLGIAITQSTYVANMR